MNERIQELYKQSANQDHFPRDNEEVYMSAKGLEKFAKLIIQECIELCEQVRTQSVSNGSDDYNHGREMGAEICRNTIFKYFGVE